MPMRLDFLVIGPALLFPALRHLQGQNRSSDSPRNDALGIVPHDVIEFLEGIEVLRVRPVPRRRFGMPKVTGNQLVVFHQHHGRCIRCTLALAA